MAEVAAAMPHHCRARKEASAISSVSVIAVTASLAMVAFLRWLLVSDVNVGAGLLEARGATTSTAFARALDPSTSAVSWECDAASPPLFTTSECDWANESTAWDSLAALPHPGCPTQ
jgi:hypothetical protein